MPAEGTSAGPRVAHFGKAVLAFALLMVAGYSVWFALTINQRMPLAAAVKEARGLVEKAGGEEAVRNDAAKLISKFAKTSAGMMKSDLDDVPALRGLGHFLSVNRSPLGASPFVRIQVRDRRSGFAFAVYASRNPEPNPALSDANKVADGIYVTIDESP
jgi:hypothetical protein